MTDVPMLNANGTLLMVSFDWAFATPAVSTIAKAERARILV